MTVGLSVVGFVIILCFVAGFLFASRAAKTRAGVFFLGILFGFIFLGALSAMGVAGCIVLFTAAK